MPAFGFANGLRAIGELAKILAVRLCRKEAAAAGVNFVVAVRLLVLVQVISRHVPAPMCGMLLKATQRYAMINV
jgi:hypothetical protein